MNRVGARHATALAWMIAAVTVPRTQAVAADSSPAKVVGVRAAEDGEAEESESPEVPPEFEFSLELASAYVFRGYNVFQEQSQREQRLVERPRFIWSPARTGLSLGYATHNQMTGANLADNVAAGLGAEQDFFAAYDFARRAPVGLTAELALVVYPAAVQGAAGTTVPVFVSAATELRYLRSSFIYLGYLRGLRHDALAEDYFYLNPRFDAQLELGRRLELELELGAGVKLFSDAPWTVRSNMVDVLASATLYYAISDVLYVGAKVAWAWTNLTPFEDADTGRREVPGFRDEYVPFWSLVIGTEISRGDVPASAVPSRHRLHAL